MSGSPPTQEELDQILKDVIGVTSAGRPTLEVIARLALTVHDQLRRLEALEGQSR